MTAPACGLNRFLSATRPSATCKIMDRVVSASQLTRRI